MRIAVCLHGESRTWQKCVNNIKHFFNVDTKHQVTYFGHTWANNSWKVFNSTKLFELEKLEKPKLFKELMQAYSFDGLIVDEIYSPPPDVKALMYRTPSDSFSRVETAANLSSPSTWSSMLYSTMISNFQKQKYELDNDMIFDIVVSTRFDQCYDPSSIFLEKVPAPYMFRKDWLYSEIVDFPHEFYQQAINDIFYFGSSRILDQVDSFYRIYNNGNFFKLIGANYFDSAYKLCGCGVLLFKWCTLKNIYVSNTSRLLCQIVRSDSKIQDSIADYHMLSEEARLWGKVS